MRGLYDDRFAAADSTTRDLFYDATVAAGADVARIFAEWRDIAGERPANPRNPADPAYEFKFLDAAIEDASARGLRVLLTVTNAPAWAQQGNPPGWASPGTWRPDPGAFGAFGEGLARRYSGAFAGPSGTLPRVAYFEAWNEPNLDDRLAPQWRRGRPYAPQLYRRMLNSFYAGVHAASPGAAVVGPGTAPYGDPRGGHRMHPLFFMRELLCLRGRGKLDPRPCNQPAYLDVLSHHPINLVAGPRSSAEHPDDATVPDMKLVRRTARAAQRAGNLLPRRRLPLWATELWWITDPPSENGFPPMKHARWLQESLYLLWRQGVSAAIWFQITDTATIHSGLFFSDGRPKPGLTAFHFPFVTEPRGGGRAHAWGISPAAGTLRIQRKRAGGWRTVKLLRGIGDGELFEASLRLPGGGEVRAEVGGERSLVWRQRR